MKYLHQLLIICLFSFLGELCAYWIPVPIPASIYGMVLLFLALALKLLRVDLVKDTGAFLTGLLPLLFVVPIVNLLDCWGTIRSSVIPIALIILVSTVAVFAVSGWVTQLLMKNKEDDHA